MCFIRRALRMLTHGADFRMRAFAGYVRHLVNDAVYYQEVVLPPLPPPQALPPAYRDTAYNNLGGRRRDRRRYPFTICDSFTNQHVSKFKTNYNEDSFYQVMNSQNKFSQFNFLYCKETVSQLENPEWTKQKLTQNQCDQIARFLQYGYYSGISETLICKKKAVPNPSHIQLRKMSVLFIKLTHYFSSHDSKINWIRKLEYLAFTKQIIFCFSVLINLTIYSIFNYVLSHKRHRQN